MAFHFYAATHRLNSRHWFRPAGTTYRDVVQNTLDAGFPVFVSEWGTNDASVGGDLALAEADRWHAYLDSNMISSCAWGVMGGGGNVLYFWNRDGNPLLAPGEPGRWTNPAGMTPHGRYVYRWLTGNDTTFTVTPPGVPTYSGPRLPIPLPGSTMSAYANNGSESSMEFDDGVMRVAFTLEQGNYEWTPYAGVFYAIDWLGEECGFGIGYTYRGSSHSLRIEQSNVTNYAIHMSEYTSETEEWTEVVVPWRNFRQPDWNTVPVAVDPEYVTAISWYVERRAGTSGEFWVKDVYCLCDPDGGVSVRNPAGRQAAASRLIRVSGQNLRLDLPEDGRVNIYNMGGRRVRTMALERGSHNIRVNNLPRGVYIVSVNAGKSARHSVRMLIR
jgi:hypothetical protein